MNFRFFYLFFVLLCWVMPGLGAAATSSSRSIHIEWGYTPPSEPQVTGYRLYQEGVKACQTTVATATAMDCTVTLVNAVTNFTLTATFADGTESPHSAPFAFSLDDDTTQTPVASTPVTSTPPTAVLATSVAAGTYPLKVSFDGSKSTAATGRTLASYQWQFGDSSSGSGSTTTHTYTQAGTFTATLTVTDSQGLQNSATTPIVVSKPVTTSTSTTTAAKTTISTGTISTSAPTTTASAASSLRLEAGEIAVTSGWSKVNFTNTYQQPIVITGPLSMNDKAPVTVRVRNVTSTGFEIRLIQWPYQQTAHGTETISYLVLEQGRHTLADGSHIEAGQLTASTDTSNVSLKSSFINTPMVFTAITSCNDSEAVSGRVLSVAKTGFSYIFQMQERNRSLSHSSEKVHYVAWEPGAGQIGLAQYETAVTTQTFTSAWKAVALQSTFKQTPLLFAEMQTSNGLNPAALRVQQPTVKGFQTLIQKEQSWDREMRHTAEQVGYLAIDPRNLEQ